VQHLADLVTERSWLLFILLREECVTWLRDPAQRWPASDDYQRLRRFVVHLAVVNDGAERGIRPLGELIDKTTDEEQLQALSQVVAWHRQTFKHSKEDYNRLPK